MRWRRLAIWACNLCAFAAAALLQAAPPTSPIERRFALLREHPPELHAFLYRMPKGGDLHNHLAGAIYAESLIRAAAEDHLCVDRRALAFIAESGGACTAAEFSAAAANIDNALRDPLIDSLSMRGFVPGPETAHDHFFNAFGKFQPVSKVHDGEFLAEVVRRAADQNESYLELMAIAGSGAIARAGQQAGLDENNFDATRKNLEDAGFARLIADDRKRIDEMDDARKRLTPESNVRVRYVFQVLREFPKEQVFAQILGGFMLAASDPRVVAVNLVQPEDGVTSMRDYHLHMLMVAYAHQLYPNVHITLHAGELALGLVPPDGLRFHIREAVEIGHAERIGHGVDLPYEHDALGLLDEMRRKNVAVEINLTSNDLILGVSGDHHPFPMYRGHGVPVALSTDDEGVSRSDLTEEYERAVLTYHLTYADVKQLVRNSIEYSFAPPDEKAELKADLEKRFAAFEKEIAQTPK
jgi:adenosine deaminase